MAHNVAIKLPSSIYVSCEFLKSLISNAGKEECHSQTLVPVRTIVVSGLQFVLEIFEDATGHPPPSHPNRNSGSGTGHFRM